jgi:hypothetical protein
MKALLLLLLALMAMGRARADETTGKKTYEVRFMENAPYGVTAWAQSDLVKSGKGKETRFVDYNSDAAKGLVLDATAQRDAAKDATAVARETAFYSVYDEKGWSLYIQAQEPLIHDILDNVVDPQSPARKEGYEIFFAPGLHTVPYYQIFARPFTGVTDFYDWGIPHRHYRSLKEYAKIESLPLDKGFGTFVFIPWEALYDRLPLHGDFWRFSIIRWMPFGKAGGVTWGGQVHDTGNFGLLHFEKPTASQETAIETRLLRAAWFKFRATSNAAATFWSDDKLGDLDFYNSVLKPVIDQNTALGQALGQPDEWNAETLKKAAAARDDWMEFDYKISELRDEYLLKKRFGM